MSSHHTILKLPVLNSNLFSTRWLLVGCFLDSRAVEFGETSSEVQDESE